MQVFRAGGASHFPGERSVCGQGQVSRCLAVSTTPQVSDQHGWPEKAAVRSCRVVLKPFLFPFQTWLLLWLSQATLWGGSCGSVFLRRAAGSLLTTLTPTRSACLTADVHGNANTHPGICGKVSTSWPKEWWLPDTLAAAIQAVPSRFGSWSWAMRATTTSGSRQTNRLGDGPPPTPSGSMWQVSPGWICRTDVGSHGVWVCDPDLQVQVHPARHANTFGFGETVFVGCQARGCAAPGRNLALYRCDRCNFSGENPHQTINWCSAHRNGLNLGSYEKGMVINRFDRQHAGAYTCRPIPPQKVHSPLVSLALGCGYKRLR